MQGDDGRYLWLRQVRELTDMSLTLGALQAATGIEDVVEFDGASVAERADATIAIGSWARPVRVAGRSVLLVEKNTDGTADYTVADKQRIKRFRP